jgi:hypothetical protein
VDLLSKVYEYKVGYMLSLPKTIRISEKDLQSTIEKDLGQIEKRARPEVARIEVYSIDDILKAGTLKWNQFPTA